MQRQQPTQIVRQVAVLLVPRLRHPVMRYPRGAPLQNSEPTTTLSWSEATSQSAGTLPGTRPRAACPPARAYTPDRTCTRPVISQSGARH